MHLWTDFGSSPFPTELASYWWRWVTSQLQSHKRLIYSHVYKWHVRWEGTSQRHKTCDAWKLLNSTQKSPVATGWDRQVRELDRKKDLPKGTFNLKGPKRNVLIRDKISFVGVAHLTRGGRSCLWALYRFTKSNSWCIQVLMHSTLEVWSCEDLPCEVLPCTTEGNNCMKSQWVIMVILGCSVVENGSICKE